MSDVKALFGLIDKRNKRRLIGAVICCVLSVLCVTMRVRHYTLKSEQRRMQIRSTSRSQTIQRVR